MTPLRRLADAGFQTQLLGYMISRLDPLDDFSGFDTLLVNLYRALLSIDRHLPSLLPAPLVKVIPVLVGINRYICRVGIGKIATLSDSGRDGVANTTFGKFKDRPLYSAYVEGADGLPEGCRESVFLCFGLLLLARLGIQTSRPPTPKEVQVADGLRKLLSNETWYPVRAFLPEANDKFVSELQQLDRMDRRFEPLSQSQKEFIGALGALGESWRGRSRKPTINRVDHHAFDDEDAESQGQTHRVRFELPGEEQSDSDDIDPADIVEFVETGSTSFRNANSLPEHRLSQLAIHAAQRTCRDNQFLPNRWRALNEKEAADFVLTARGQISGSSDRRSRLAALVASLVFITSQRTETIADFVVVENLDPEMLDTFMCEHVIDLGRKGWWHSWPALPGRFMPTPEQVANLVSNTDWIFLPLPDDICDAFKGGVGYPLLLSDCLGCSPDDMERMLLGFCTSLRRGSNRTSPARVRAHGFDYAVRTTADDTFASGLQGTVEYAPYSPLYYYAFPSKEGVLAHTQRMESVGWPIATSEAVHADANFGSRLQPTEAAIKSLVEALRQRLANARTEYEENRQPATLAQLHNALAVYTLAIAIFSTGHRRAREYSIVRWTLDLECLNLMVADKIVGTANSVRSVPLPEIAAAQIDEYLDHLGYLASRVSRFNPVLAASIRSLCQSNPGNDALPMLFLLDETLQHCHALSHEVLRETVGDVWPLPWHAARHRLEMDTRANNLSAEYNHYRSGHISTGQQPYSPVSPLVPERTIRISAQVVDQILRDYGWVVELGLGGRLRTPDHFERKAAAALTNFYLPGPVMTAQNLASVSNVSVVLGAIAATKKDLGKQNGLNDGAVELIREKIVRMSSDHPFLVAERLNLLRKILKRGQKTGLFRLRNLPGIAAQYQETPAFLPDAAWRIRQAEALRRGFLDGIALNEARMFEDYLDRISFSLVAFSAFTDSKTLMPALHACFSTGFAEAGFFWVEFHVRPKGSAGEGVLFRRPLDPITTCLVLTARAKYGLPLPQRYMSPDAVKDGLCRTIDLARKHAGLPIEAVRSVEECCRAFVPYWRFRLPGILAAWCEGRISSASMSRPDFLRMLIGIRPAEAGEVARPTESVQVEILKPQHRTLGFVKARKLMRRIGQILRSAHSDSVAGGKDTKHYAFKLQRARKELADLEERLNQAPQILQAIADWITHLIEQGGASGKRLQASSIATYYWSIAYPLLEFFLDENIAELDDDALEDLYSQSLDSRSENTRIKRARVLRQFHTFCVARYGCLEVDWYEIEPLIDTDSGYVDANIVTPYEYALAMDALRPHIDAGVQHAFKLKVLLLLMYRAGLRMGEAFRLTLDDFVLDGDTFILLIRGNRYGRPKSPNGRRQIYLGWRITDEEREFVVRILESRRQLCGDVVETALFGSTANPHHLDLRRNMERSLGELLRWATGRVMVRPHHLRHSMGSYCVLSQFDLPADSHVAAKVAAYFCGTDDPGARLRQELLGHPAPSRRVMHAICAETGHGSPRMLLSTYVNCLDISLAETLRKTAPVSIGDPDDEGKKNGAKLINKYARPAALSGFSDARLRKLMHGGINVAEPTVLACQLISRNPFSHGLACIDHQAIPALVHNWEHLRHPGMEQIHSVLAAASQGFGPDQIADVTLLTKGKVTRLIESARRLVASCRYEAYRLTGVADGWAPFGSAPPKTMNKKGPNMPSKGRSGDALERFSFALCNIDDPVVRNGLFAWARAYRPSIRGLVCDDPSDFRDFWRLLRHIGYDEKRIVVAIPMVSGEKQHTFREHLKALGMPFKSFHPMGINYLGLNRNSEWIVPSIIVKRRVDSAVTPSSCPMIAIHQYCYLCLVNLLSADQGLVGA